MTLVAELRRAEGGNLQKHTSGNRLQRWLIRRFHEQIARLTVIALAKTPASEHWRQPAVLEVGCGEGFVARYLAEHVQHLSVVAGDSRGDALGFAAAEAALTNQWLRLDAYRLPVADRAFPVVLCLEVLEHLERPWDALGELRRVCSGTLILSVPNQPYFALGNLARGKNFRTLGDDAEHLSHWRGGTFLRLLRQRLPSVRAYYAFPWIITVCDLSERRD